MAENPSWCTIESDPGVFTALIEEIGVKGVQVEELYDLSPEAFSRLHPVYGLVFLFKWDGEHYDRPTANADSTPDLFFAKQVIPNACATQAILSVLMNAADRIELGQTLSEFREFSRDFPPDLKGLAIGNSERVRLTHNSFSRQDPFVHDGKDDVGKKEDAFHFVAYVPHGKEVYELDGLQKGPIKLGEATDENTGWLAVSAPAIQERIARYASSEIRFNLMALVRNRRQAAEESLALRARRLDAIEAALAALSGGGGGAVAGGGGAGGGGGGRDSGGTSAMEAEDGGGDLGPDFALAKTAEELDAQRAAEGAAAEECRQTVRDEKEKFAMWAEENVRRKHNYIPLAMALLRCLAEKGHLQPLMDKAKRRKKGTGGGGGGGKSGGQ